MRIADEKIEEIRRSSDIVDVISSYLPLKKRGKNYLGLCPFHQEKTPSFNVSPEKQMFHCFGCGVGGNVFTFVMDIEKVSFVESVRTLAERAGISLPESPADRAQATEYEGLYDACKAAGLHYYDILTNSSEGQLALEYFRHRGFSDGTIRKFGLGYAKNGWDDLVKFAEAQKQDLAQYEKAGLILMREEGKTYYDRFRGRAMFPIFSPSGRTIGFGARRMREDDPLGKYINSPETPIYNKSRNLYGLYHSKEAIREKGFAILVEGYADLISVYQAGIENIVASSGTALTDDQIDLVGRYAKTITLVYDADSAGSKATMRGVDLIIEHGLDVNVATLPEGEDPDSFVKSQGGPAFSARIATAVSFLDFKAAAFREQGLLSTPEGKTRAVRSIVETIARVKDEIKRNFYIQSVAEKFQIYESVLFRELESILGRERNRPAYRGAREVPGSRPAEPARVAVPANVPLSPPERDLLKVMLDVGPPMVRFVFGHITPEAFANLPARKCAELLIQKREADWDATSLLNEVGEDDMKRFIADIVFTKYEISKGWSGVEDPDPWVIAEGSIIRLKTEVIDRKIAENFRLLKSAQHDGAALGEYQEEHVRLQKEKKEVETTRLLDRPGIQ
jgi:DNA primase